jgi:hypothetical protein
MPPLTHWPPDGYGFDIKRSEVCKWLTRQPEVLQELFNWAKNGDAIEYDVETRTWRGAEWRPADR